MEKSASRHKAAAPAPLLTFPIWAPWAKGSGSACPPLVPPRRFIVPLLVPPRVLFWEVFYDLRMASFCYSMMLGAREGLEMPRENPAAEAILLLAPPDKPLEVQLAEFEAFIMSMVNRIRDGLRARITE